jgi:hypothetical protein
MQPAPTHEQHYTLTSGELPQLRQHYKVLCDLPFLEAGLAPGVEACVGPRHTPLAALGSFEDFERESTDTGTRGEFVQRLLFRRHYVTQLRLRGSPETLQRAEEHLHKHLPWSLQYEPGGVWLETARLEPAALAEKPAPALDVDF